MRELRLLDRIREMNQNPSRRVAGDTGLMTYSIREHLQRILNTRQGNVPIADDYGIPDFTNLMNGFDESRRAVELLITASILKYEPRLKDVKVSLLEQGEEKLKLRFQILAQLKLADDSDPVMFESILDAGGKFTVKN